MLCRKQSGLGRQGIQTIVVCAFLWAWMGAGQVRCQETSPADVLESAVQYRRTIKNAVVKLTAKTERINREARAGDDLAGSIWLSGTRLRNDLVYARQGTPPLRTSMCRNCPEDKKFLSYTEPAPKSKPRSIYAGFIGDGNDEHALRTIDPRVIGMDPSPFSLIYQTDLESLLARNDRQQLVLENGHWKGHDCLIVRFVRPINSIKQAVWIIPGMGSSVGRIEVEAVVGGVKAKTFLEIDLQQYGKSEIWFPKAYTFVMEESGVVFQREVVSVLDAKFNEAVSQEVFTIGGMDVPVGNRVKGPEVGAVGKYAWDGKEITKLEARKVTSGPGHEPINRTWLVMSAIVLGGLGSVLIVWWFWKTVKAKSSPT